MLSADGLPGGLQPDIVLSKRFPPPGAVFEKIRRELRDFFCFSVRVGELLNKLPSKIGQRKPSRFLFVALDNTLRLPLLFQNVLDEISLLIMKRIPFHRFSIF